MRVLLEEVWIFAVFTRPFFIFQQLGHFWYIYLAGICEPRELAVDHRLQFRVRFELMNHCLDMSLLKIVEKKSQSISAKQTVRILDHDLSCGSYLTEYLAVVVVPHKWNPAEVH